jgi:hypothetical protein
MWRRNKHFSWVIMMLCHFVIKVCSILNGVCKFGDNMYLPSCLLASRCDPPWPAALSVWPLFFCTQTQWPAGYLCVYVCVCDTVSKLCIYLDIPTAYVIGKYLSVLITKIRAVFINVHDMKCCFTSQCKKDASWEADSTSAGHNLPRFCRMKKLPWAKRMYPNFIKCFV